MARFTSTYFCPSLTIFRSGKQRRRKALICYPMRTFTVFRNKFITVNIHKDTYIHTYTHTNHVLVIKRVFIIFTRYSTTFLIGRFFTRKPIYTLTSSVGVLSSCGTLYYMLEVSQNIYCTVQYCRLTFKQGITLWKACAQTSFHLVHKDQYVIRSQRIE